MKRRIIAMLLAIAMLVGNVPAQVYATEMETQETAACITEGCSYGAGHAGECSTFVACGNNGCTYAAGHAGDCSSDGAPEESKAERAADAAVYITVSNRGEIAVAYEAVAVSDSNLDGKLTVDEALHAAHTAYGKGYASENGTVTKLWDEDTSNVSFFLNHAPISGDVREETVSSGDYLVASVDQDAVNDYDKYSRFDVQEKSVKAGESFSLMLTDDAGNALAGMEIGLSNGSGNTTMTGLTTDVDGAATLTLDQEGLYCVTAKGTVVESSIDVDTMEITSIEIPIVAPVCVVKVSGNAQQQPLTVTAEEAVVQAPAVASYAVSTVAEGDTDLSVSGATVTMAPSSTVGPLTLTSFEIYKQNAYPEAPAIVSATQNGTTVNVILAEDTDPSYPLQLGFSSTGSGVLKQSGNTCTLNAGQGTMSVLLQVYPGFGAPQPTAQATYTVNFTIPMGTAYTVTPPTGEGFTFTGKESVYEGKDYTFTVSVSEGYDGSDMLVKVNGETVTGTDGSYTVSAVSQNLEITVEGIVKKELCTVTLTEGEGYTISSDDTPYKGEAYTFTVTPDSVNYKADTLQVLVDGEEITGENGVYTIPALQQDHVVTVNLAKKAVYTVTKNSQDGVTITGADTVLETDPYTFRVAVDNAYDASGMKVLVNDQEITLQEDGSYTIESAAENITITVTGVAAKVIYKVTLTEGENYTISGQTTSYAGEPYTFAVAVDDAIYKAADIVVKVNEEAVNLTDGKYTIDSLAGDTTVTVENVVERQLFTVTKPEAEGVTVTGEETVREGKPYTFSVAVNDGYDGTNLQVTVNEETVTLTDGSYTVESVSENLTIAVSGVTAKVLCNITLTSGKGYTISGAAAGYAGDSYSFTVTVNPGYNGDNMTVTVNGSLVSGTDGTYTITLEGDTAVEVTGVERVALPTTELTVSGNVIDITDRTVYSLVSSIYAKATNITISGGTVLEAYENGTTVYVILGQDTADDGSVNISFGTALNSCTMEGTTGSVTLNGGEGSKTMTLTGKFSNSRKGTATYTIIFFREEPSTTPPVLVQATDTAEVYQKRTLTLNLEDYFTDADSYYLVTEEGNTALEGSTYSITPNDPGTLTLVFAAANEAGESPEKLTVTVTVKEIEGGIWLDYTTSNGSVNYVTFTDANGNPINGMDISCEGKKISVVLPKTYDLSGTVTATFNRTANDSGLPFLSSSNAFNHGTGSRVDVYTNTLSSGAATRSVYLYNAVPKAVSNVYETITISYAIKNDLPILAEGVSATAEATITAGENYTLDLSPLFTDADGDPMTYLVSINGAAAVAADAAYSYTTDTAGTYTLVFTANDGKGTSAASYTVTLTVKNSDEKESMTVNVPEGLEPSFYVSTGFGDDGLDIQDAAIETVKGDTVEGMTAHTLSYPANASMISVRTEEWGGMAFAAEEGSTVALRQVQMNVVDYDSKAAQSTNTVTYDGHKAASGTNGWLLVTGRAYTYTAVPGDTATLATASKQETLESGSEVYTLNLTLGINNPIAITVTTGARAQLYKYDTNRYYCATELEPKIISDNGNGTTTYFFIGNTKENGACFIYRVSMSGKITKAGYLAWGNQNLTVTHTSADKSNTYRLEDYSATGQANSGMTEDSVLLNINGQNHLAMSVGDTKTLKAYRVWEIIKISYQNYIITPDFTYNILSGSDVVSLTEKNSPSVGDGDWMTLTALKEGTAVIEVTYDAMEVAGGSYDGVYGASDPARTGLMIVQVGGNDTSVSFGIDGFSSRGIPGSNNITYNPNNKRAWDAEFDTLYFTGTGGELQLSPTASGSITEVAVSHTKGASWQSLTAEDGVYTAPIVSGNNILRVTTEEGVAYQVVRGDKITAKVTEQSGNGNGQIEPGETARVTLTGLHMAIPKMAGNYNPGYAGNNDGYSRNHLNYTVNGQTVYGPGTQYDFVTSANYLDIVIPEDIQTDKLVLEDGYIGVGVLGLTQFDVGGDSHRNIPDSGCSTRESETTFHTRSVLPEVTIPLAGAKVPVTGVSLDKTELTMNVGETQTLTATVLPGNAGNKKVTWSSDPVSVAVAENGVITARAAGTATITVTTEDGEKTATCTVTVKQPVESISVTPAEAEVEIGRSVNLTAEVLPENASDKTVVWTSGDETIATVNNGVVTGMKAGTVTITAAAGEKTAVSTVTVKEIPGSTVEVYFSVSHDAEFVTADTGKVMALQKLTVPYFDLEQYGMGEYGRNPDHADFGKPTMLHLYIYATERFQYGISPERAGQGYLKEYIGSPMFAYSGAPGSICIDQIWNMDMNLNYYHNYVFPAEESGYGITADRVVLKDGDIVTIGHFDSWDFHDDSSSIFNYLAAGDDTVVTTLAQHIPLTLQVYRAGRDLGSGGSNTPVEAVRDIYYGKADALTSGDVTSWTKLGTTDSTGKLTADISDLAAGQYVLAVAGQKGVEYPDEIVSTPGGILLNVTESTLDDNTRNVFNLIKAIGEVTLEDEQAIAAAREAYNVLSDEQKAQVTNYPVLTEAEEKLAQLKADKAAVDNVIQQIESIGEVTLEDEATITAAREAYDALREEQKAQITNLEKLTEAEARIAALKKAEADKAAVREVINLIEAIGEVTLNSEEDITAARGAYEALAEALKPDVTNYAELLAAEEQLNLLKLSNADIAKIYRTTGEYLSGLEAPGVGSINGEWRVIGLARAGKEVDESYYDAAVQYVSEKMNADGRLHQYKSTDNSRLILALTAIGKDVTDVGGHDLLSGLNEMEYIGNQGVNGYIWALLAFDSHDYPCPAGDVSRESLIDAILEEQLPDGGWTLSGNVADSDMTGMALQALAPYYRSNTAVKAAVDKALDWAEDAQNKDGTFSTHGLATAESVAQMITGLTALGIDPETDSRFVKNGISVLDALAQFYVEGGGFKKGSEFNMMSTEQGYYALVAYYRFLQDQDALYDMSGVTIETGPNNQAAANRVIALINDIGTVDLDKEDEIKEAREAYEALTKNQKNLVSNYKTLTDAETALARLQQTAADAAAADAVKDLIDAIGTVDLTKENAIKKARQEFNKLTTLRQNLVGEEYRKKLTDAEEKLESLKQEAEDAAAVQRVIELISKIPTDRKLNKNDETVVQNALNAYNALDNDTLRNRVSNRGTLLDAVDALNTLKGMISVTFTLLGCSDHDATVVHTLADGNLSTWIAAKTYSVKPGATVMDLLEQALKEANMTCINSGNYVESITRGGVTLAEFTNGKNSGWMYTLNGTHPGLGVDQQTLKSGDKVIFHYTDDFTREEGSNSDSDSETTTGTSSSTTNYITTTANRLNTETADSVDRLIEDIGEEITLESEAKILAARAAYDKLTEAQKKLVKNYDALVAAEAKLAELKSASGENVYVITGDYLQSLGTPGVGAIGGEWMVIGLARSGRSIPSGYYEHVVNYVRENINAKEQLHSAKSSDNSRMIMALTAMGKDVTDVDGHNLLKGLNDMDYIQKQGINGPIWALMAFDSGNYPVPEGNVSREKLIRVILEAQLDDGGWALSGERSDPDMTGMAIQALAPYLESNRDVEKAVEEAIRTLSEMQNDNGSFSSIDGPNSESIAQVIVALAALGIDADTDARFVKNGISAMDALLTYFIPGGGFKHILDGPLDGMSTEQAYYALVAYERMKQNQNFLYDMTDIIDAGGDVIVEESTEATEVPTEPVEEEEQDSGRNVVIWTGVMGICAAAIAVILLNRKKLFGLF